MTGIMACAMMSATFTSCDEEEGVVLDYSEELGKEEIHRVGLVPIGEPLHVEGRFLKGPDGQVVNLHGMGQTYSPWFNHRDNDWPWSNYDVAGCLRYNQQKLKDILDHGWCMDFVRLHMDPHWTVLNKNDDGGEATAHLYYNQARFEKYLDEVFVPMAEYMQDYGLRVVMRPPGVCPEVISLDDKYLPYLKKVWKTVANHPKLKNNPNVMFELANEPVNFRASDGKTGHSGGKIDEELSKYFQEVVDVMRAQDCNNILWIPGTCWQQNYDAYVTHPIQGKNIGYAVHCYPGWFGSDCYQQTGEIGTSPWTGSEGGYSGFKRNFDNTITNKVGAKAPIMITEMDWCSNKFPKRAWGSSTTGKAGGKGFGENFKQIMDEAGNVSYLIFTNARDLAAYDPKHKADASDFIYDPESCVVPVFRWFREYWEAAGVFDE